MKVGYIGLGKMGRPMAQNILKKGFHLTVHNRSRGVVEELARTGATPATSSAEVAEACDIVLTCLPNTPTVEEVYLGEKGLISAARAGQVLVDHGTIGPSTARKLYEAAKARGASFLDAPVSGGVWRAQDGTLTIMVGGDSDAFEKARPVLEAEGKLVRLVGPIGSGSVIKLVNNMMQSINMMGVVEGMVLGVKAGVDPQVLYDILTTSTGTSAVFNRATPLFLKRDFVARGALHQQLKDLNLVTGLADELSVRLLAGNLAKQFFIEAKAAGFGDLDLGGLILPLEKLTGVEVKSVP
ncbi:MAG: NAD(P)-dependent oxidoreductase [Chloroflexi bacterium]|nr:NAD(P)-dependent oxidoreductase [Chloroflexota bacterium]